MEKMKNIIDHLNTISDYYRDSVIPFYTIEKETRPNLIGSGIYIKLNNYPFILTAKHVIKEVINEILLIHANETQMSTIPNCNIYETDGALDIAFIPLVENLALYKPIDISSSKLETNYEKLVYIATGYPKNKTKIGPTKTETKLMSFLTAEMEQDVYKKYGMTSNVNILTRFNQKGITNGGSPLKKGFTPNGMSGGGLFAIKETNYFSCKDCELVGMLIEWNNQHSDIMISYNIKYIKEILDIWIKKKS